MASSDSRGARKVATIPVGRQGGSDVTEADDADPQVGLVRLSSLALLVGLVTGFGAVGFRDLIGLIHNALFLGQLSWHYDANLFTPASPWGAWVILVPVIGALVVTYLVTKFA